MLRTINSIKLESLAGSSDKNQKRIENHKKAASHFQVAHNRSKALKSALIAQRDKWLSGEFQLESVYPFCD
ncbi:MAG: hypothetical protein Q8M15_00475 [Bacteroidota bacterium]|nr:hypothetical protein [Bacteroidota bacterium]